MRHDPAGAAIVIMLRSLKLPDMAHAVQDLMDLMDLMDRAMVRHLFKNNGEGAPALAAAMPILSQLLKAEMAEREVRSIHCPAVHVYMHERGLSHEGCALPCL